MLIDSARFTRTGTIQLVSAGTRRLKTDTNCLDRIEAGPQPKMLQCCLELAERGDLAEQSAEKLESGAARGGHDLGRAPNKWWMAKASSAEKCHYTTPTAVHLLGTAGSADHQWPAPAWIGPQGRSLARFSIVGEAMLRQQPSPQFGSRVPHSPLRTLTATLQAGADPSCR
jgi:hypothetical protein